MSLIRKILMIRRRAGGPDKDPPFHGPSEVPADGRVMPARGWCERRTRAVVDQQRSEYGHSPSGSGPGGYVIRPVMNSPRAWSYRADFSWTRSDSGPAQSRSSGTVGGGVKRHRSFTMCDPRPHFRSCSTTRLSAGNTVRMARRTRFAQRKGMIPS